MRFIHIADAHIGGYKDQKMKELVFESFRKAIQICIDEKIDFLLISGDIFNTSHPGIDELKFVVSKLKELNDKDIPVYAIAGSHDFSASGKTMLDVLEEAGLVINVVKGEIVDDKLKLKFTIDHKTGAKITGMLGKKGMLEKKYYEELDKTDLENAKGPKIFMFHTAIDELKPKELERMESSPISLLPKNFDYYAGGHVHIVENKSLEGYDNVVYPGPIYPMNIHELEELKNGSMFFFDDGDIKKINLPNKELIIMKIDVSGLDVVKAKEKISEEILKYSFEDKIVILKVEGQLGNGKVSDINLQEMINLIDSKMPYFIMKNTSKLHSKEFDDIKVNIGPTENIEDKIIDEHSGKSDVFLDKDEEKGMIKSIMTSLSIEKKEGEKVNEYERRIKEEMDRIMNF